VKEDDVGRACSTNVGEEECIEVIRGKAKKKVQDVRGWIKFKRILREREDGKLWALFI
jgi:hypothetical protein